MLATWRVDHECACYDCSQNSRWSLVRMCNTHRVAHLHRHSRHHACSRCRRSCQMLEMRLHLQRHVPHPPIACRASPTSCLSPSSHRTVASRPRGSCYGAPSSCTCHAHLSVCMLWHTLSSSAHTVCDRLCARMACRNPVEHTVADSYASVHHAHQHERRSSSRARRVLPRTPAGRIQEAGMSEPNRRVA